MNITNIIDVLIVLIIACAAVIGFKRGFFKELVMTVGFLLVFVISFYLKNPIAEFLSIHLPFIEFGGVVKGATVLNIILYQLLAFILVFCILFIIFETLLKISGFIEKVLNFTIILGIPSKILGAIVGAIEGYIIAFLAVFILNQPVLDVGMMKGSELKDKILNSTPILTQIVSSATDTAKDIYELTDKKDYKNDVNKFNRECIDIMLEHKMITVDYVEKLIEKEKIKIPKINSVLDKYR